MKFLPQIIEVSAKPTDFALHGAGHGDHNFTRGGPQHHQIFATRMETLYFNRVATSLLRGHVTVTERDILLRRPKRAGVTDTVDVVNRYMTAPHLHDNNSTV